MTAARAIERRYVRRANRDLILVVAGSAFALLAVIVGGVL